MKYLVIFQIAFILLIFNGCVSNSDGYEINGTISGYDSSYVFLKKITEYNLVSVDSVMVIGEKFKFKGVLPSPQMHYLMFGDMNRLSKIFLENSKINFNAHIDSLQIAQIYGSESHNDFVSYEDEIHPFENKMADLFQQYKAASDQGNSQLMNQIDSTRNALNKDMDTFIKNFIGTNKSSAVAPYILFKISGKLKVSELDSLFDLLDNSLEESLYTQSLKKRIEILKELENGKKAPDFRLNDTGGNQIALSLLKGKVVLLSFWAEWNIPSRLQNQYYSKLYTEFKPKGFEILSVSLDKDKEKWQDAIKNDKLAWSQVSDLKFWDSEVAQLYGVSEIPCSFLIDKEGIIIGKNLSESELRSKLLELTK
jgi:peroxiredoxin